MAHIAYALRDVDTVVPVTVTRTHRRGYDVRGYDVRDAAGHAWFTLAVWDTADEAARVAGDLAHDLDL